ncbi:pyridoxamine 5'-phosphate oxidase family protein [Treponema primitia ZAS-2]|uniref:Pyridoxamine 5'-phosphate oxidase family protein n=1 Tax=Treponema primitia (strain ATCC BAA-887 / DSM 12427 / ZAS-2) TaxID=545694 RepID=F5YIQ0_TREPZ|nr:pyridoxamine 5'-phosphate oxidase family protein [Treponema primitia]AEF86964.1 pyridoxamine 5'-phosphate oxidase family protein [Treponema primitia ZAS-2]
MIITDEIKKVIEATAFITLVTINPDGTPHPIIAGKGQVEGDTVVFGIYKMEVTQKNLAQSNKAWLVGATKEGGPKGYRLAGTAEAKEKKLVFTTVKADILI